MSRSGAQATRSMRHAEANRIAIATDGLMTAAEQAHAIRSADRVQRNMLDLERLLTSLGLIGGHPFVLDEFRDVYGDEERVCVEIEGLTFNYTPETSKRGAYICLIIGRCTSCGKRPNLMPIRELADIAYAQTPPGKRYVKTFRCWECKEIRKR